MKLETFYIETFGCSANQNSSEIMAGLLVSHGFIQVNNEELADIIILNTCVVKEKTENKIKRRIQDLKEFSGKKLLVVAGCMPQIEMKKIRNLNKSKNVMFLGTFHVKDILNLIRDFKDRKLDEKKQLEYISENKEIKLCMPKIPGNKLISIQQISEGCLGNCSFCRTRLAKGKLFSYPEDMIIKSIEGDLNRGAKEIWITSQDNAVYGLDWNESDGKNIRIKRKI
jgi:tRNA A37 methylthiotransferase MiaB